MTALSFHGVGHAYDGRPALHAIDLELGDGEILCLVGPSGCGKTTALRLAAGLETLAEGAIRIGGRPVAGGGVHLPPEARGVGMMFQDFALFPHMTVAGNVGFGLRGLDRRTRRQRIEALLARVGLGGCGTRYPHGLSGGEQQRVALARALAPGPRVMLLDEPFSGLDVRLREEVRERTLAVLRDAGAAALVVTHDAEEAMYMGDRIAVLQAGRLVQAGRPAEVYRHPGSAFVARFLGETNRLRGFVRQGLARSPLGCVAAGGLGEGEAVDVLVRPESLSLVAGEAGGECRARVLACHPLGHSSLVTLGLDGGQRLRARIAGREPPPPGTEVAVVIEEGAALVFPREGCPPAGDLRWRGAVKTAICGGRG